MPSSLHLIQMQTVVKFKMQLVEMQPAALSRMIYLFIWAISLRSILYNTQQQQQKQD